MSASLFGGIVTGVVGQVMLLHFANVRSWVAYLAVWALAVVLGATLGGAVLKATLARFDYRIAYYGAVAALVAGQVVAAFEVGFHLGTILPIGVLNLITSVVIVWYVARFAATRAEPEPL